MIKTLSNLTGIPQFGSLTEIQMENGKRTGDYDGQCVNTVRTS